MDMAKPIIRFKGYQDDWEQRKLGDVAEYRNGKAHENEIDDDGEYIVVNSKFVSTNGEIKKFSNAQNEPLYENEIAFVLSDVPNGRAIARTFLIDKSGKYTLNQRIAGITPHEDTDPYYLHIKMNRNAYFLKFDDGNKQTNLSIKDVLNYEDMYPKYKEQQKIGNYFRSLDHLITLHQRKCDETKRLKKYLLQKMFPQNGEKVPEIRFSGFTDDWEQRKLGELCNITTGKLDANAMVSDGQYDFYTSGIDVFKIDVAAFEGPAITIAGNGASVGYMHLADGKFNAYQRTYVLTDFLADRQFLNVAIGNELPNKIREEVRGSGIPYIVLNMLTDLAIPFPSHEEQYAIGVYFQQLDHLITLHQRELENLQNIKRFMLGKMFV